MITVADIAKITADEFAVELEVMRSESKDFRPTLARHVAMVVASERLQITNTAIAEYFAREHNIVNYAECRIENEAPINGWLQTGIRRIRRKVDLIIRASAVAGGMAGDLELEEAIAGKLAHTHAQYLAIRQTRTVHVESRATMPMKSAA